MSRPWQPVGFIMTRRLGRFDVVEMPLTEVPSTDADPEPHPFGSAVLLLDRAREYRSIWDPEANLWRLDVR